MKDYLIISEKLMGEFLKIKAYASFFTPYGLLDSILYSGTNGEVADWLLEDSNVNVSEKQIRFLQFMYTDIDKFKVI